LTRLLERFSMKPFAVLVLGASLLGTAGAAPPPDPKGVKFFEEKIRPVLVQSCYPCHSRNAQKAKKLRGGLFLDSRDGLRKGGDSGPLLDGLLLKALRYDGDRKMPPKGPLPKSVVADFETWLKMGAPDPRDGSTTTVRTIDIEAGKRYWAFQPTGRMAPPESSARNPIDAFLDAKRQAAGLTANGPATREKLLRRVYFGLTGLPPSPQERNAFLEDAAPDAYECLVDRLLQSERFGERWARHWLDVVRFAESGGYEFDGMRGGAYHYRDFVIKAFNKDLPFNEFVCLQIAGDHLKPGDYLATSATGFVVAGPFPGQTTAKTQELIRYDHLDDMLATLGTSMLGLSMGCARCHDHKYDPLPQRDYYRLLAAFARTDSTNVNFDFDAAAFRKAKAEFDRAHAPLLAARDKFNREQLPGRVQAWLASARNKPVPPWSILDRALLTLLEQSKGQVNDKNRAAIIRWFRLIDEPTHRAQEAVEQHRLKEPKPKLTPVFAAQSGRGGDVYHLIRGEVDRKNGVARPGFLQVLTNGAEQRWLAPASKDTVPPRVALANWITDTEQGAGHLLARVIVNRLWQHHFGKGLVATPNDFGTQGEPPTHPELLDWLAAELIRGGWKLKPIHKLMVTSAAYAQSSDANAEGMRLDPRNRLMWRRTPRRLEAEAIRDALLAVSGTLDSTMYGPGTLDGNSPRRSIYLTIKRSEMVPLLQLFDAPESIQSIGERSTTTAATQALALMNSPFVRQRAEKLSQRVHPKKDSPVPPVIEEAYRIALSRSPSATERLRMQAFIEKQAQSYGPSPRALEQALTDFCQVLLCLNEFVYLD
jgi:hypothetical protein